MPQTLPSGALHSAQNYLDAMRLQGAAWALLTRARSFSYWRTNRPLEEATRSVPCVPAPNEHLGEVATLAMDQIERAARNAWPMSVSRASECIGPTSCKPTGSPFSPLPQGTDIAG